MKKGYTLMHEHITIDLSRIKNDPDTIIDLKEDTIKEFQDLYAKGVRNILDVTNIGMGRNVEYLEDVKKKSGINIIPSTGFYKDPFFPSEFYDLDVYQLSDLMVKDILEGIDGTNIKAKVIGEIGTSLNEWTKDEKKLFEAAVIAHKKTGALITTHTSLGKLAMEQVEFFIKHKVDLSKVIIGHQDLNTDTNEVINILKMGVNIGFDTIGKNNYRLDDDKIDVLLKIQELGYMNQVILSMDITRKSHLKSKGGIGYSYIIDNFLPRAIEKGISNESIEKMLIYNPRRLLEGVID